jgi:hypothetical protein
MSELYDWQAEGDFAEVNNRAIPRSLKLAAVAAVADLGLVEANQAIHHTHVPMAVNVLSSLLVAAFTYAAVERNSQSPTFPPAHS